MPKRNSTFTDALKQDYPFLKKVCGYEDRVKCEHCLSEFSVSHGGRSDIKEHLKSTKHKASLTAIAGSSAISSFFKSADPVDKDLLIAAKEATFAFHTAAHYLSFKTADCSSKLISKFFEPKFGLARTKCEAIIINMIAPMAVKELNDDLSTSNFVTLTIDASNRKAIKIVPCIVRYFVPEQGVKVKLLEFQSVPGETSEILANYLVSVIKKNDLVQKVVGFCGDNCNTNFGGVKRKGVNNVYVRLKKELARNIVGIGCGAHIVHNCLQTAVDVLPIEVEALVVKIYKYFYIYTVRVTELKEFCDFVHIEYKNVLQHGTTRFLSLLPAIERLLLMYEGLKSYFLSQEQCPKMIKEFFESDSGEMYLWFVRGQLTLFNKTILAMEKTAASATDIVIELENLKHNLQERRDNKFVPQEAKKLLKKLEDEDCGINSVNIIREFTDFYDRCLSYIELWENSFGGGESFTWINNNAITWPEIEIAGEKINETLGKPAIIMDELFDEVVVAKAFWSSNCDNWKTNNLNCQDKWVQLFRHFKNRNISVDNLSRVVEYIFCLPGSSAPVERAFSIMNNIWSEERGKMAESTVKGLMICKLNIELSCSEFYDKIKNDKPFLKKVHTSNKYEWFQPADN